MLSKDRDGRITGSSAGACMGVNRNCNRKQAFRRIIGIEKFEGNEATQWGSDNEVNALNTFESNLGVICEEVLDDQQFHIHTKHNFLGCTPDGFTLWSILPIDNERSIIEFKCPYPDWKGRIPDEPRPDYYAQVQFNMEICGCTESYLTFYMPEQIRVFRIAHDPEYVKIMLEYLEDFYHTFIETKTEPPRFSKSSPKPTLPEMKWEIIYDRQY